MKQTEEQIKKDIMLGNTALGIEFGSTRIKAVLTDGTMAPAAQGIYEWENRLDHNIWTYSEEDIMKGLKGCYADLAHHVRDSYGIGLTAIGSMGISAMMHGYLAIDREGQLLVPFRTWRNTITAQASRELTEHFHYNIPQRWSIAHLYQAVLNGEKHVSELSFLTTLAGFVHWKLTGEKVLGVGDASGMFPIDLGTGTYDSVMAEEFGRLIAGKNYPWTLEKLLPKVLTAGEKAGFLTKEGAELLDDTGVLQAGIPLCPPEGDAATGMTATNSVAARTGNVSAGTSVFAMAVLEKPLSKVHPEIDLVTTPTGRLVAMVHCNNCTSDLNAWVRIFKEFCDTMGIPAEVGTLFDALYHKAMEGDADCGGLLSYCYLSGEPITGFEEGRPLFMRTPESRFSLANFMKTHLYSSLATLKIGLDILFEEEGVILDKLTGHGGFFKTKDVGQAVMATAVSAPVSVMETAGEGGAWGIAVLASYMRQREEGEALEDFLNNRVFADTREVTVQPDPGEMEGFNTFIRRYREGLQTERSALKGFRM